MAILLLIWLSSPTRIPLPEQVLSVGDAVGKHGFWYILDHAGSALWKIDHQGNLVANHSAKGPGPGEFLKPMSLYLHDEELLVCDALKRLILVFDLDLNFKRDHRVSGLCRAVKALGKHYLLVMYHPETNTIVQQMDADFQRIGGFGSALSSLPGTNRRLSYGLESGTIAILRNQIFYMHNFIPVLEIYAVDGDLIRSIALPGFKGKPFLEDGSSTMNVMWIYPVQGSILIALRDHREKRSFGFAYRPESNTFIKLGRVPVLFRTLDTQEPYSPFYKDNEPSVLRKINVAELLSSPR